MYQTFHRGQADYHVDHYDFLVNDHSSCVRIDRLMQVIHIPVSLPCLMIRKILMNLLSEYFIRFNLDQYLLQIVHVTFDIPFMFMTFDGGREIGDGVHGVHIFDNRQ